MIIKTIHCAEHYKVYFEINYCYYIMFYMPDAIKRTIKNVDNMLNVKMSN